MDDFIVIKSILKEFIFDTDRYAETILELMQNHKENEILFSSIIGFFYQYGICCGVDKNKAIKFYLSAINNEIEKEPLNL